jgi:ATP synthase regulation protein NCA2
MMNALYAMDEMKSSNDINMNLAAVTPSFVLMYGITRMFQYFTYALLKLKKSREETYASFRDILTDIERLLVMRDNPPQVYISRALVIQNQNDDNNINNNSNFYSTSDIVTSQQQQQQLQSQQQQQQSKQHYQQHHQQPCVLGADDLGMLMLLVHECRSIMWKNRRRFTEDIIRSVSEDLAELAGERGMYFYFIKAT